MLVWVPALVKRMEIPCLMQSQLTAACHYPKSSVVGENVKHLISFVCELKGLRGSPEL